MGMAATNIDFGRVERLQEFLNDLIERKGISQKEIADKLKVSHSLIWKFRKKGEASEKFIDELEKFEKEYMDSQINSPVVKQVAFTGTFDFIRTRDAENIIGLCMATESINGIGVVIGNAGTGKTRALKEYAKNNPKAVYIRADCLMSAKGLLKEIGRQIGAEIEGTDIRDMMYSIVDNLSINPKTIIIDEVEQLMPANSIRKIEIIRTIHDLTKEYGNSLIMAGPPIVEHKLKKRSIKENYGQIDSRIDYLYKTQGLSKDEIMNILDGFNITESAKQDITNLVLRTTKGGIRWLSKILKKCTDIASVEDGTITRETLKKATSIMMI
ncbi:AAA family ATPase [Caloranaerobacter sp. DY30410]|uniref:AAA family ATPase n=1 Tax=Caloranaerobacter sp. DY30410 TaxID=3238305 RepID=UPI003D092461